MRSRSIVIYGMVAFASLAAPGAIRDVSRRFIVKGDSWAIGSTAK